MKCCEAEEHAPVKQKVALFVAEEYRRGTFGTLTKGLLFSCPGMRGTTHTPGFLRLLQRKAPLSRGRPGDKDGNRETLTFSSQYCGATWNCGGLPNSRKIDSSGTRKGPRNAASSIRETNAEHIAFQEVSLARVRVMVVSLRELHVGVLIGYPMNWSEVHKSWPTDYCI